MTEHTYKDTTWVAFEMGSEGWSVFAGPKMVVSHLAEDQARSIVAAHIEAIRNAEEQAK